VELHGGEDEVLDDPAAIVPVELGAGENPEVGRTGLGHSVDEVLDDRRAAGVKEGGFPGSIPQGFWLFPGKKAGASSVALGNFILYAPLDDEAPQTFARDSPSFARRAARRLITRLSRR
jgi:hypothetical protein